jgi:hypothetical protein
MRNLKFILKAGGIIAIASILAFLYFTFKFMN